MPPVGWRELAAAAASYVQPVAETEIVTLRSAAGRTLAEDVAAVSPLPANSHAVMDGYALGRPAPGSYALIPGSVETLSAGEAAAIKAGEPTPFGTAAVVLADKAKVSGERIDVADAWAKDNIRRAGEEAAPGAPILRAGVVLDARHAALAAAAGVQAVTVRRRPRVALLAVADAERPLPHLPVATALLDARGLQCSGGGAVRSGRLAGELARLATREDLAVLVGDSLGDETGALAAAIAEAGGTAEVRRAALKPAKPIITGRIAGMAVIGFSGTAYAATVAAHLFLRPLLLTLCGRRPDDPLVPAVAGFERARRPGRAEVLPVTPVWRDGRLTLGEAGRFGQLTALAAMDGFALIEAEAGDVTHCDACLYHPLLMPLV